MSGRLALLFLSSVWLLAGQGKKLGSVDFFSYDGIDVAALREALPVRAGQAFSLADVADTKKRVGDTVLRQVGRMPSDVATVCCDDRGDWILFIGLSREAAPYRSAPAGAVRLPKELTRLEKNLMAAWIHAVEAGTSGEDRSRGYALSSDPKLRSQQLKLRSLALRMEAKLFDVLANSSDAEHRAIAANGLGYARQSPRQMQALVDAARDPSSEVRNNAVRALGVLLESNPALQANVPVQVFTGLLQSGIWTDRNKGTYVLLELAGSNRRLLDELAATATASLKEMAQWQSSGHAYAARTLLERIATKP